MARLFALLVSLTYAGLVFAGTSWNWKDELAQATCTAMSPGRGWVYAVRKPCILTYTTKCDSICRSNNLKSLDNQIAGKTMKCFNSLHVYERPQLRYYISDDTRKLGLKMYKYNSCFIDGCGPNFCCCRAI